MKRRNFIALISAFTLIACSGGDDSPRFRNTDLSAGNLFPTANLLDSSGRPRNFEEFRGKVLIVFFGYTSCPDICPGTLRKYASLIRTLRNHESEKIQVLFITVDPARDTPKHTDTYVKWFNPSFIGLSGNEQQIADVARQFKVIYSKQAVEGGMGYVIDHTTAAYLIDPKGQLRLAIPEAALLEPISADLRTLLEEK